jgi:uncharacterized membrane protein YecN with MAPEG domain
MDVVYLRPALAYYVGSALLSLGRYLRIKNSMISFEMLKQASDSTRTLSSGLLLLSVALMATAPHDVWVLGILWAIALIGLAIHAFMIFRDPAPWYVASGLFSIICILIVAIIAFAGTFS